MSKLLLYLPVDLSLAMFASANGFTVKALQTYTCCLTTLWADQHHIRYINGSFELNDPRIHGTPLSLDLALVLLSKIDSLNYNTMHIRDYLYNFTAFSFILKTATYDLYRITFSYLSFHVDLS